VLFNEEGFKDVDVGVSITVEDYVLEDGCKTVGVEANAYVRLGLSRQSNPDRCSLLRSSQWIDLFDSIADLYNDFAFLGV
jgi:hypothetical protein